MNTGNLHDSGWQHILWRSVILGVKSTRTEQRTNSSAKTWWNIDNETLAQHRAYCILKARFGGKSKFEVTLIFTSFPHGMGCHGTCVGRLSNRVVQIRTKESFASKPVPSLAFCCRSGTTFHCNPRMTKRIQQTSKKQSRPNVGSLSWFGRVLMRKHLLGTSSVALWRTALNHPKRSVLVPPSDYVSFPLAVFWLYFHFSMIFNVFSWVRKRSSYVKPMLPEQKISLQNPPMKSPGSGRFQQLDTGWVPGDFQPQNVWQNWHDLVGFGLLWKFVPFLSSVNF